MGFEMELEYFMGFSALFYSSHGAQRFDIGERIRRSLSSGRHARSINPPTPEDLVGLESGEHLEAEDAIVTSDNTVKVKYLETYKGIPVMGESIVLETDIEGQYTDEFSGQLVEGIAEDVPSVDPTLSKEAALDIAQADAEANIVYSNLIYRSATLVIYLLPASMENEHIIRAMLAYRVDIGVMRYNDVIQINYIIDANTGEIDQSTLQAGETLWRSQIHREARYMNALKDEVNEVVREEDLIDHTQCPDSEQAEQNQEVSEEEGYVIVHSDGGNEKIGKIRYGEDVEGLKVQSGDGITCRLMNSNLVALEYVNDNSSSRQNITELIGHEFPCYKPINDSINGGFSPLTDAFFGYNKVNEMFENWYSMPALKHRSVLLVHYDERMENAFYYYDGDNHCNVLAFGDGADRFYPLVSIGVVGHEMGHGFTSDHSDLIYASQSGGINEAFSDMTGEAADAYFHQTNNIDWMVGAEITKEKSDSYRWLWDPPTDQHSIDSLLDFCPTMNVHHSSGVFNKAFYLLATRPGWDIRNAFHVFVVANKMYWRPDTDFSDGACGAIKAAKDLGFNVDDVTAVFEQVDITPCVRKKSAFSMVIYDPCLDSTVDTIEGYFTLRGPYPLVTLYAEKPAESNNTDYHLSVTHNGKQVASLSGCDETNQAVISDPEPGRYFVKMTGDLQNIDLLIVYYRPIIERNEGAGNWSFVVNYNDILPNSGIIIRSNSTEAYLAYRYGNPPEVSRDTKVNDGHFRNSFLNCKPKPGTYYVTLLEQFEPGDIILEVLMVLGLKA